LCQKTCTCREHEFARKENDPSIDPFVVDIEGRFEMKTIAAALAVTLGTIVQASAMDSLSQYDWKNRVLVLFGDPEDLDMRRQIELLRAQTDELSERDMIVLQVSGDVVKAIHGRGDNLHAEKLRADADIQSDGFHAILVGKDGGVKLRSNKVVGDVEMFDFIDRMPMRRAGQS